MSHTDYSGDQARGTDNASRSAEHTSCSAYVPDTGERNDTRGAHCSKSKASLSEPNQSVTAIYTETDVVDCLSTVASDKPAVGGTLCNVGFSEGDVSAVNRNMDSDQSIDEEEPFKGKEFLKIDIIHNTNFALIRG